MKKVLRLYRENSELSDKINQDELVLVQMFVQVLLTDCCCVCRWRLQTTCRSSWILMMLVRRFCQGLVSQTVTLKTFDISCV